MITTAAASGAIVPMQPAAPVPLSQRIGLFFLLILLFFNYSRIFDFQWSGLAIPRVTFFLTLSAAVFAGGWGRVFSSPVGRYLTAFTLWLALSVPFSFWQGGSYRLLVNKWLKSFLCFVLILCLVRTLDQCRKAIYVIALSVLALTVMCLVLGRTTAGGRLALEQGALENPNDLAHTLLTGLPFLWLLALHRSGGLTRRLLLGACMIPVLVATATTGSRGAMVAAAAMISVALLKSRFAGKMKMLISAGLAFGLLIQFLPDTLKLRYGTLFRDQSEHNEEKVVGQAEGSMEQRKRLLKHSIELTFRNPVFGVGPGVFMPAAAADSEAKGQRPGWQETHNTYTQVSAEAGLPALFFYLGALLYCLRQLAAIHKASQPHPELAEIKNIAFCLLLSLVGFAVDGCFFSIAYSRYFPTLAGLSMAFIFCAREKLSARGLNPALPARRGASPSAARPARSSLLPA